jgi:hypothetical protein
MTIIDYARYAINYEFNIVILSFEFEVIPIILCMNNYIG